VSRRQRAKVEAIKRRRNILASRLRDYSVEGDVDRTRAECAALTWALSVIAAADREGILTDLESVAV
jgi:hypothetical protein